MNKRYITSIAIFFLAISASYGQSKLKIDLAKKIADATPAELPQSPVATSVSNDARDKGLKGKVRSVVEFIEGDGGVRETETESYFNENGNMTRQIFYDEAYPETVVVFGYVDGMRVWRSGDVHYAQGEKPPPRHLRITVKAEDSTQIPDAPRDKRYEFRTVNKYDSQGRLIETSDLQNNGELWHRRTIQYEENRRMERVFRFDGQEVSRTGHILDASGNVVEQHQHGGEDEELDKYVMRHQFDSEGNWIVERTYQEKTVKGKKVLEHLWTTHRTITYYP